VIAVVSLAALVPASRVAWREPMLMRRDD